MSATDPVARLRAGLRGRLDGELRDDDLSRSLWATDGSIYRRRPRAVVTARSERDVRRALGAARAAGLSVTPRGGGTSLAGQATGPGLMLDVSGLNALHRIDPASGTCSVGPGTVQAELNGAARPHGLEFGADTSTAEVATIGGMVANNSAGMRSIQYGTTADQVRGLRCVLADGSVVELEALPRERALRRAGEPDVLGRLLRHALELGERHHDEIRRRFPPMIRRVSGYGLDALIDPHTLDLTRLVCGSEGTLAVVTRADLALVATPPTRRLASIEFGSLAQAAAATPSLLNSSPSALELFDRVALDRARQNRAYRDAAGFVQGDPDAVLLIEYSGQHDEVEERLDALPGLARAVQAKLTHVLPDADRERTIALRRAVLPLLLGTSDAEKPVAFVEDAAVPPERLEEFVARFQDIVREHGTWACFYGHASVGTLHVRPALNTKDPAGVTHMREMAEQVADLVVACGGSISGEHGDGLSRSPFLSRMYGAPLVGAFAELKRTWDPAGILNPGVIVDPAPMTSSLRLGPDYRPLPITTHLDFSAEGGFPGAVEMCNGAGFCRKTGNGTMCPSYMVTADEQDTTRARANALRSILDGTLAPSELTGPRLHEVMELCVSCKACKTECPSRVDVAALKTEVLAQRGDVLGFSARQRAAAHADACLRAATAAPALVNALGGTRPVRLAAERLLGIDRRRRLPAVARRSFRQRFDRLAQGPGPIEVALFNDTWTNYQRPDIGEAAVRVLAAAGARVLLPRVACCGRPMLSQGLVEDARRRARRNVELLSPLVERGVRIAGLEPSCVSALRDDYRRLLPGDPRAAALSDATRLWEEAVLELSAPPLRIGGPVLLHGHCHQKALFGMQATSSALELAGADVRIVDSGCCGMAGLFGYEREHYNVSMRMAERRLLPAVRAAPERMLIAAGASCREQIADGTGRQALHPAQYLAELLVA